jgi:hypothetical protein
MPKTKTPKKKPSSRKQQRKVTFAKGTITAEKATASTPPKEIKSKKVTSATTATTIPDKPVLIKNQPGQPGQPGNRLRRIQQVHRLQRAHRLQRRQLDQPGQGQPMGQPQPMGGQPQPMGQPQPGQPQPMGGQPGQVATLAKTKRQRQSVRLTVPEPDEDRHRANVDATQTALERIYGTFYDSEGQRMVEQNQLGKGFMAALYNIMGMASASEYLNSPISEGDFDDLVSMPNSWTKGQAVASQKEMEEYTEGIIAYYAGDRPTIPELPKGKRTSNKDSLTKGDYFHVHNTTYDKNMNIKGRARRIIVNVKTQEAALDVAKRLSDLYQDDEVSPFIREYKVYLSSRPTPAADVKHDKLVVYYALAPGEDDSSDDVGNKIAAAIQGAVREGDVNEEFAPFYSRVGPGIAWAEEPKHFVDELKGSFTTTRRDIIAQVIKDNPDVTSAEAFKALVDRALETAKVDPERPHRHLAGAAT